MIIGCDSNFIQTYVMKDDRENPDKTIFHYRLPSLAVQHKVMNKLNPEELNIPFESLDEVILDCLVKVDNYKIKKGDEIVDVAYNDKMPIEQRKKILETLPIKYRAELGAEILNSMNLQENEEKN